MYTQAQVDDAMRKTLTPSILSTYLAVGDETTTPSVTASTPTVVIIPTTVKAALDFEIKEIGSTGVFAFFYTGSEARYFKLNASTGMQTGTNNVTVTMSMGVNGSVLEGCSIPRKVSTGADVGALGLTSYFELQPNDYLQVFIEADLSSTVTFIDTVINLIEVN